MSAQYQEKKFRVDSLEPIEQTLAALGAKPVHRAMSTHYYAKQAGNNVTKLVVRSKKSEIHILTETDGKFSLTENIAMKDKKTGLKWLKDKGYDKAVVVTMEHTDYKHQGGIVGLYVINDSLCSVILEFPSGQHEAIQKQLGLDRVESITMPYNRYLENRYQLKSVSLAAES